MSLELSLAKALMALAGYVGVGAGLTQQKTQYRDSLAQPPAARASPEDL